MEDDRQRTLLIVDDEENILRSLRRLFRREGYRILTAGGGAEGLELLSQQSVGVIISDQRMPEMTGSEFLHRVNELYPDTVRLILSGYTDLESVTDSINRGAIFKFLTKPWDDDLLCMNVKEAFRIYELNEENQRLTDQLQRVNQELELRVEEKTRQLSLHVHALSITQDILEELPISVLGISQGQVVVANRRARERLTQSPVLIGQMIEEVCPAPVAVIYRQAEATEEQANGEVMLGDEPFYCQCTKNVSTGPHDGFILTIRKVKP